MTSEEAIAIAKRECEAKGWQWIDPMYAVLRKTFDGKPFWWVTTDRPGDYLNENLTPDLFFEVSDETGEVLSACRSVR
jgi:hypothetical protein